MKKTCESNPEKFPLDSFRPKIQPFRIVYRVSPKRSEAKKRILVHGYKHIDRLSACGLDTFSSLRSSQKSNTIKYIRKFEFDPYLCDHSYLKQLAKSLKKFRTIQFLNIVIPRLEDSSDMQEIAPWLPRMLKMKRMRCELPNTTNLNSSSYRVFVYSVAHCFSMNIYHYKVTGLADVGQDDLDYEMFYWRRMTQIRECDFVLFRYSGVVRELPPPHLLKRKPRLESLRKMSFLFGMTTGWISMSTEVDETALEHLHILNTAINLRELSVKLSKASMTLELVLAIVEVLPKMPQLKKVSLEFLNSRISDQEMMILSHKMSKLAHLEKFTLKILQYPNVSEGCILHLVNAISKHSDLIFDLYFRRLSITSGCITHLINRLKIIPNIKYDCFRQASLYISRHEKTPQLLALEESPEDMIDSGDLVLNNESID